MLRIVARDSRRARTMPVRSPLSERDAGALHRDVGAGAHGDADIGRGERRRVVDAVAGHRDHPARVAQPLDDGAFPVRQHLGLDLVDAEPAGDGFGGRPVVAGEHDDAHAVRLAAPASACRRRGLDRIGDGDHAGRPAVDGDEDRRRAVLPQRLRRILERMPDRRPARA